MRDKTVLITGATSGIGQTSAELFALGGATVVAVGRNTSRGQALVERLEGSGHSFVPADLSDKNEAQSLVDKVTEVSGTVDILVNSAGVALHATVPETDDQIWENTMAVNLNAIFYLCRGLRKTNTFDHGTRLTYRWYYLLRLTFYRCEQPKGIWRYVLICPTIYP